ncbi:acyl carrier protein [Streptomyces sp. NPDC054933]
MTAVSAPEAQRWLIYKIAQRLGVQHDEIAPELSFNELDLDYAEALTIVGEMDDWLGIELGSTAVWYYPTIKDLAQAAAEWTRQAASA